MKTGREFGHCSGALPLRCAFLNLTAFYAKRLLASDKPRRALNQGDSEETAQEFQKGLYLSRNFTKNPQDLPWPGKLCALAKVH